MKKTYLLICAIAVGTTSFAQQRIGNGPVLNNSINLTPEVYKLQDNKAVGDTLMYFDSRSFYLLDNQDRTDFALANEDLDGNAVYGNTSWTAASFQYSFIDTDPSKTPVSTPGGNFFPRDITSGTDTAWYIGATSWFTPAATSNNWFSFGPITIPSGTMNNTFTWYDKNNSGYTEKYEVYLVDISNVTNPATPNAANDVLANSLTPNFTKSPIQPPATQPAADTSWTSRTLNVDAFVGSRMFIYFRHNTNDGDNLYLDQMTVVEGSLSSGIEESNKVSVNVFPNPSKGEFTIRMEQANVANVNLSVKNVVGQVVMNENFTLSGKRTKTISLKDFGKGIYFLTVDNQTTKLIVE